MRELNKTRRFKMPNYCYNKLTVRGKSDKVKKFYEENVIDGELSFNKSVPCTHENWYDEHTTKWGTKWDAQDTFIISNRLDKGLFVCSYWTAWNSPISWFDKVTTKYSDLSFTIVGRQNLSEKI